MYIIYIYVYIYIYMYTNKYGFRSIILYLILNIYIYILAKGPPPHSVHSRLSWFAAGKQDGQRDTNEDSRHDLISLPPNGLFNGE